MATRSSRLTDAADEAADAVRAAGRRTGASARRAGADLGDAIDGASATGATRVRRAARSSADAYDEAADEFEARAGSIEDQIRRNPIAAAGAALVIGLVLGRFVL